MTLFALQKRKADPPIVLSASNTLGADVDLAALVKWANAGAIAGPRYHPEAAAFEPSARLKRSKTACMTSPGAEHCSEIRDKIILTASRSGQPMSIPRLERWQPKRLGVLRAGWPG